MDDPKTKTPPDKEIHLPWESINPEESDPALSSGPPAASASKASAPPGGHHVQNGTAGPSVLVPPAQVQEAGAKKTQAGQEPTFQPGVSPILRDPILSAIDEPTGSPMRGGGWTLPLICAGISLIACCLIIPQADSNRRLAYEKRVLQMDLDSIKKQVSVNDEFLKRIGDDPTLAERLAQRQMKVVRAGSQVIKMGDTPGGEDMSPFQLVNVNSPPPFPPYKPVGGVFSDLCYRPRSRLYLTGMALFMIATGLVLGFAESGFGK